MEPSTAEVLAHYGYSMEELRKEGEVGTGIWNKEEAFVRLGSLPDFMKFVDSTKKARIIFEYDPDYPKALLIARADLAV